jgi:lysophospholipase L1-like esterase
VAIGDSSTEGLLDPDGNGGYRGWANRLAERLAAAQGSVLYANLGVRGRRTRQIREQQLPSALAMRPDLATLFSGTNDVVARSYDAAAVGADIEAIQRALVAAGATVLTFTLPDLTPVMPLAWRLAPRVDALNAAVRAACARSGAILLDFAAHPVSSDSRLWSEDRLHANAAGHARIAAALAHALELPGSDDSWSLPLPPPPANSAALRLAAELRWWRLHLVPWLWRHLRGRSSGDGLGPKRPLLSELSG